MALRERLLSHAAQPPQPQWSPLAQRAAALVHTGAGDVRDRNDAVIPTQQVAATRPDEDGSFLIGRSEEGQTRLGRWNLLTQPTSLTAFCLAFRLRRSTSTFNGYLASWGENATALRCHVLSTNTTLTVSVRQGQFDTPRVQTYSLTTGVTYTWAIRVVAGVGIEVYRDGALLTPSSSSGTMPASSLFTNNTQPIWFGGVDDFSAMGTLSAYALWLEDIGADRVRALSADIHNELHEPLRILVPVSAGGGAQTVSLGQSAETDFAQALTPVPGAVTGAIAQATETDAAQAFTVVATRTIALGQPAETDTAQAFTAIRTRTLAIGQPAEADTAQPVTAGLTRTLAVGQVVETDAAQAVAAIRTRVLAVGQPVEADSAQTVTAVRTRVLAIGQPVETDTAQPASTGGTTVQAIAQAIEADSAQPVTAVRTLVQPVPQAQETDSAQPVTPIISGFTLIGQAQEVDTAQPVVVVPGVRVVIVGQAVETDTAQAAAAQAVRTITAGLALEIDTAQAFTAFTGGSVVGIGQAVEADLAFAVSIIGGDTSYIPRGTLQAAIIVAPDNNTVYVPYEDRTIHAR